jgi:3-oxoacyl-[acyl-carrier protein] reductase
MIDFTGKVALITGGAGGIPRATALLFNRLGASLVLTDIAAETLDGIAATLPNRQARCVTARVDVTSAEQVDAACAMAKAEFGGIDMLVCAAGWFPECSVDAMTDAHWQQVLAVNLDGVMRCCRAGARILRDGGAIVNVASRAGHAGVAGHSHYAAAKAGVLGFSRSLAQELAPRNIRVNCVSPGLIETAMSAPLRAKMGEARIAATPLRRNGQPEEIATAIAFLCSDWASYVTGETLHVNGGAYMAG